MAPVLPSFVCELAFGNNPGDSSYSWTDVSTYLRSFHITRGRQYELNEMQAGTCDIVLKNLDRRFEPMYASSPYYPNIRPMVPVRISAVFQATTYRLFQGFVERFPQNRTGPTYAETQVQAVDGFELLTNAVLPGATYPQELSGARIGRVLDAAGWSSTARSLATGQSQIISYTFLDTDLVQPLSHIQDVTLSELGAFFIAGNGNATFLDRYSAFATTSSGTFTDQPSVDVSAVGYTDITVTFDTDLIVNDWRGTRSGGSVVQEAIDSSSISKYFLRTQARTPLLPDDATTLSQMQSLVATYKDPALRVSQISLTPGSNTSAWTQVLAREIGDRITIREHPPGGGAANVQDSLIQNIDLNVSVDRASAKLSWGVLSADSTSYLVLDSATNGTLDSVNKLGY